MDRSQPLIATNAEVSSNQRNVPPGMKYAKTYRSLGIAQMVLGTLCLALGGMLVFFAEYNPKKVNSALVAVPVWCGFLFFVPGILGVVAGRKPEQCQIISCMVTSILSALASCVVMGMEVVGATESSSYIAGNHDNKPMLYEVAVASTFVHAVLSVVGLVAMVTSIVHASCCCAVVCCQQRHPLYCVGYPHYNSHIQMRRYQPAAVGTYACHMSAPVYYQQLPLPGLERLPTSDILPTDEGNYQLGNYLPPSYSFTETTKAFI